MHGADVNARNGIIENHNAGVYNGTTVHDVTVKNVFLRGIYTSSGGTGFNIHDCHVDNVRGGDSSIGMFTWGGGIFQNNVVTNCYDSISANHSKGTQWIGNQVTCDPADRVLHGTSGIHTDNAGDGGGSADLISGNTVTDCAYGLWVFVPYIVPQFRTTTRTVRTLASAHSPEISAHHLWIRSSRATRSMVGAEVGGSAS